MKNNFSIKGKLFSFTVAALAGLLTVFEQAVVFGALMAAFILLMKKQKKYPVPILYLLGVCYLIFVIVGVNDMHKANTALTGEETAFTVVFRDKINIDGNMLLAYAETYPGREKIIVKHRIKTEQEKQWITNSLLPGTACRSEGSLEAPPSARNPAAFDYQAYLKRQGIHWMFSIENVNSDDCFLTSGDVITKLRRARQLEMYAIEEEFPAETAALANALIFGDRNLFDPETEKSYRKIGIVHLLAISGLHVALLTGMLHLLLVRIGVTREKAGMLIVLFLPIYTILTGLAPPVVRASGMLLLLIGTRLFRFSLSLLDVLSSVFMLTLLAAPQLIYDTGFQLSFAVSFALIVSARWILSSFGSYTAQLAAVSAISQLAALPIIIYTFYEVSLISLIANLIFVPLFSFVMMPLIFLSYLVFLLAGSLPSDILAFLEAFVHKANVFSSLLASVPGASLVIGKPPPFMLVFMVSAILAFFLKWERAKQRKIKSGKGLYLLPIFPLMAHMAIPYFNPYGEITFIDVGQGDSILISLPYNKGNYLVDTGGMMAFGNEDWEQPREAFDPGEDIVLPLLKSKGIRRLDKLILTHGDADHIGGAPALIEEMEIGQILLPRIQDRSPMEKKIINLAHERRIPVYFGGEGTSWKAGEENFRLLNPDGNGEDRNESSIVLFADIAGKKWLFTGDMGTEGEARLNKKFGSMDIDILKVGHHGSKTSTSEEFLDRTEPEYAIISVKKKNMYGHPHSEVVDRLKKRKTRILRTDENGAVIYRFKGESGTFRTQLP